MGNGSKMAVERESELLGCLPSKARRQTFLQLRLWEKDDVLRSLCMNSPAPHIAAQFVCSNKMNLLKIKCSQLNLAVTTVRFGTTTCHIGQSEGGKW